MPGYGPLAGFALTIFGLLAGGLGTGVAAYKNSQAKAAQGQADLHQSTLQAVVTGVENALPAVQQALAASTATGSPMPANVQIALNQANSVISAVKGSIQSAAAASGTLVNLNANLAQAGVGPTAP